MINGFEDQTHELTDAELEMVQPMVAGLVRRVGEHRAITADDMIAGMKLFGYKVTQPRIRKLINFIRVNKLVRNLIATSKGYYVENDPKKLQVYLESLDQRIRSIQEVRNSYDGVQTELL
jgi:hypothetical protein